MTRGCYGIYVRQSRPFFFALPERPAVDVRKLEPKVVSPAPGGVGDPSPPEDRQAA